VSNGSSVACTEMLDIVHSKACNIHHKYATTHRTRQVLLTDLLVQYLHLCQLCRTPGEFQCIVWHWLSTTAFPCFVECLGLVSDWPTLGSASVMRAAWSLVVTAVVLASRLFQLHMSWRGGQMLTGWCWVCCCCCLT
jgi:hypothetical protein